MIGREARRRLDALSTRALALLRHHYFSLITAGVLGVVAAMAATSASFEEKDPRVAVRQDDGARWAPVETRSFNTRGRSLIYYLVESADQATAIHQAIRGDMVASELSGGRYDFGLVYFLEARTPREEAEAMQILNTVVEAAPLSASVVTIIDLRE